MFKKSDPSLPNYYRPIYLTCTLSKIRHNVVKHAQKCNILSPSQHGFLANRSTSSQLLECLYDWCSADESGHVTNAVYIDF